MSWLNKELQVAVFTTIDVQIEAYNKFLKEFGTQELAIAHTDIFMRSVAIMTNPQGVKQ